MYFEIYKEKAGIIARAGGAGILDAKPLQWRWRLKADNYKTIADSGEGYDNKKDCEHGIDLVKGTGPSTPVKEV